MRSLFFVSVAVGMLSGTALTATAQTSINLARFGNKSQPKFIDGIELKRDAVVVTDSKPSTVAAKKTVSNPVTSPRSEVGSNIEQCTQIQFKYAMLMDIEVETVKSAALFNFIEEWWATRYRYGGTTKHGVDCSSYTGKLMSEVYGLAMPRTAREQYRITERISREDLLEGDLVFFNTRGGVSHVGVYVGNGYFTHSSSHSGVTLSSLNEAYYSKRYIGGGRVNENFGTNPDAEPAESQ